MFLYRILSCGFVCEIPDEVTSKEIEAMIHTNSYDVRLQSNSHDQRLLYRHTVSPLPMKSKVLMKDQSTSRIMTDDPFFNSTVSRLSDNELFFPAPTLYQMQCTQTENNATCLFGRKNFLNDLEADNEENTNTEYRMRISHDVQKSSTEVKDYWVNAISIGNGTKYDADYEGVDSTACEDNFIGVIFVHFFN